jgi:hypothetical protein
MPTSRNHEKEKIMDYQELVRLSTKGDEKTLENLFALAEKLSAEKNTKKPQRFFETPQFPIEFQPSEI